MFGAKSEGSWDCEPRSVESLTFPVSDVGVLGGGGIITKINILSGYFCKLQVNNSRLCSHV